MSKIIKARITAIPQKFRGPMPQVIIVCEGDTQERLLFEYYPDEISFTPDEFIGLTPAEALALKFKKDKEYLQS